MSGAFDSVLSPAGEYCLATDAQGRVDTVYREFKMTARQLEKRFGKQNLPATVHTSLNVNRGPLV